MANRRNFLQTAFGAGAGLFASRAAAERTTHSTNTASQVAPRGGYQETVVVRSRKWTRTAERSLTLQS
jgi:hypothetical protein